MKPRRPGLVKLREQLRDAGVIPPCPSGKAVFLSRESAMDELIRISGKRIPKDQAKGHPVRVYRCGRCGQWHLTSMTRDD